MSLEVGKVVSVRGIKIILKIDDSSSKDTLFYNGVKYKGVTIREHIIIRRGFKDIVCLVEGEYLDKDKFEGADISISYVRKVEVKPIGYFSDGVFFEGIKFLPMINDPAFLVSEDDVRNVYGEKSGDKSFLIGSTLKGDIPVSLPWRKLFNTHIGIFGNTGSGKSNTLAKLFTVLFEQKLVSIIGKSQFVFVDFNGEYTGNQLIGDENKKVINLSTKLPQGLDKFVIDEQTFWNSETLGILFKATQNTQIPFINRIIRGRERYADVDNSLFHYIKSTLKKAFTTTSPKREAVGLLQNVASILGYDELDKVLRALHWHSNQQVFFVPQRNLYFDGAEGKYQIYFGEILSRLEMPELAVYEELQVRANLQLTNDLLAGYVQFDFIQPLLKRIEASVGSLRKVIEVSLAQADPKVLTIVNLRSCNQETKKVVPLLLAKYYFENHKSSINNPPDKTLHLVIDEAHNILSDQSMREFEVWKDYRLELFEEIVKEGRKFGVFLTISSQRPADISPTVTSQIHNFFIHRLVNEKDLHLIDSTISTLDTISKSLIPNLGKGACVITGTSFDLPVVMQIDLLKKNKQPDSEDVDLDALWSDEPDFF